jgi:phage shock protein E
MKPSFFKIFLVAAIAITAAQTHAADLTWLTDLPQAQAKAKAEKKSVLLFFHGSDWCPACAEMQKHVFASPEFTAYAGRALILMEVDFPEKAKQPDELKQANAALKVKFNVGENFPTIVLLNESGETIYQESGYNGGGPKEVLPALQRHVKDPMNSEALKYKNVTVDEFEKLAADKQNVVLDVRTGAEYAGGHIAGAINLDVNAPDFAQKAAALDKSKTYLVHCAAGVRSVRACDKLAALDFPNLYNLPGGFKAWEKAGKPVAK